jgi:hypothetical protein
MHVRTESRARQSRFLFEEQPQVSAAARINSGGFAIAP